MHTRYLRQYLTKQVPDLAEDDLQLLLAGVQLRGTRTGYELTVLKEEGDRISGYSLKPFQLLRIDQRAFQKKLLTIGAQSVLLTTVGGWWPILASLLLIAMDFEELHFQQFTEEQARLLLLLYLADTPLTEEELYSRYETRIGEPIAADRLTDRLSKLRKLKLINRVGKAWQLQETVIYRR